MKTKILFIISLILTSQIFSQEDITPPKLESFDILTETVNVESGDSDFKCVLRVSDDISGIYQITVTLRNSLGNIHGTAISNVNSSEDVNLSTIIKQYSPEGIYQVTQVALTDNAKNQILYFESDLENLGFKTTFEVTSISDITPPKLEYFNILTETVNVESGDSDFKCVLRVSDDISGIYQITVTLRNSLGNIHGTAISNVNSSEDVNLSTIIKQYSPEGIYQVTQVALTDNAKNQILYFESDLENLGYKTTFEVVYNHDSDNDGINDDIDICPDTPVGEVVDDFGCTKKSNVKIIHYPNPFIETISFLFELPKNVKFQMEIYNQGGYLTTVINEGVYIDNKFEVNWNSKGEMDGVYFYKLYVGGKEIGKGTILKSIKSGK